MPVLRPYVAVLRRPGALGFAAAAVIGRLWLSMLPLGIVLLVSATTHRYGLAGAVTATASVVGAIAVPTFGRLVDRLGQRRVLLPALVVHASGVVALLVAVPEHAATFWLFVAAVVGGIAAPPLGSLVRARWAALLGSGADLEVAYALESVLDEAVFMAGPVVTTMLATTIARVAGVATALALTVMGTLAFAAQHRTEPAPAPRHHASDRVIAVPGVRVVIGVYLATGVLFGSFDVSMVAFATAHGNRSAAGWLLALIAGGSFSGGLLYGAARWRMAVARRFAVAVVVLAVCSASLIVAPSIGVMAGAALVTGVAIAPGLIASSVLIEQLVPKAALTEGLAIIGAAIGIGFSIGAPLAGHLVDIAGPRRAFAVGTAATSVAAVVAVAAQRWLQTGREARPGMMTT